MRLLFSIVAIAILIVYFKRSAESVKDMEKVGKGFAKLTETFIGAYEGTFAEYPGTWCDETNGNPSSDRLFDMPGDEVIR